MKPYQKRLKDGTDATYYRVRYKDESGKPVTKDFSSKRSAKEFESSIGDVVRQKKNAIKAGIDPDKAVALAVMDGALNGNVVERIKERTTAATMKVADAIDQFVAACRVGRENHKPVRTQTADSYAIKLRPLGALLGEKMVSQIDVKDARAYRDHLIATRGSRAQAKNSLVIAKMLFAWLITDKAELTVNPFDQVRVFTDNSVNADVVTDDDIYGDAEIALLMGEAENQARSTNRFPLQYHKDLGVLTLMVYAGLRIGEALACEWADVNLANKTVTVKQSLTKAMEIGPPKTSQGFRTVALHPKAVRLLKLSKSRASGRYVSSCTPDEDGVEGRPTSYRNMKRTLDRLMKGAGIPPRKPHSLRHYFASKLIDAGYDGPALRQQMGHADLSFTVRVYGHLLNRNLRVSKDVDRMAEVSF